MPNFSQYSQSPGDQDAGCIGIEGLETLEERTERGKVRSKSVFFQQDKHECLKNSLIAPSKDQPQLSGLFRS